MRRDSTVEKRFIELGPEFGNNWVVERGLVAGEQIVTEDVYKRQVLYVMSRAISG